jgi:hypothetical protein
MLYPIVRPIKHEEIILRRIVLVALARPEREPESKPVAKIAGGRRTV